MGSTFFGFEIGKSGVYAAQRALDVTAHNISNANTKGYSRQEAVLTTNTPFSYPSLNRPQAVGQLGTGVKVDQVRRMRDSFVDYQLNLETTSKGAWTQQRDFLQEIELAFNEVSDTNDETSGTSIGKEVKLFWEKLENLQTNPENTAVRSALVQQAENLSSQMNHVYTQLNDLRKDADDSIKVQVSNINTMAQQIANLNDLITKVEASGDQANDYRDKRDALINSLSEIAQVQVTEMPNSSITVRLDGNVLVQGKSYTEIKATQDTSNDNMLKLAWADGNSIDVPNGALLGLLQVRDQTIPGYMDKIDQMAYSIVTNMNAVHRTGYGLDGLNQFTNTGGTPVSEVSVNQSVTPKSYYLQVGAQIPTAQGTVGETAVLYKPNGATWDTAVDPADGNVLLTQLTKQIVPTPADGQYRYESLGLNTTDRITIKGTVGGVEKKAILDVGNLTTEGLRQEIRKAFFGDGKSDTDILPAKVEIDNGQIRITGANGADSAIEDISITASDTNGKLNDKFNSVFSVTQTQVAADAGDFYAVLTETAPDPLNPPANGTPGAFAVRPNAKIEDVFVQSSDGLSAKRLNGVTITFGSTIAQGDTAQIDIGKPVERNFFDFMDDAKLNPSGTLLDPINTSGTNWKGAAKLLKVSDEITGENGYMKIATSRTGAKGDGSVILDMAELNSALTMESGTTSFTTYYNAFIGKLGIETNEAIKMVDNQDALVQQLQNRQEEVSGVSMDEELTNMIKFQHSYNAAAKVINAMDELLDRIINGLGAGR